MTRIVFDLVNVADKSHRSDRVVFRAPTFRKGEDGKIITPRKERVGAPDGFESMEVQPGPLEVELHSGKECETFTLTVPDVEEINLSEFLDGSEPLDPTTINDFRTMLEEIKAQGAIEGAPGRGIANVTVSDDEMTIRFTDDTSEQFALPRGSDGEDGEDGRGIAGVTAEDGTMIIKFTDDTTEEVVLPRGEDGQDGEDGEPGSDGRGISDISSEDGVLTIRLTDNTETSVELPRGDDGEDGKDGRGIAEVSEADGYMTVVFTDGTGTTIQLPRGEDGQDGKDGSFADLTEEERESLRGPKGDKGDTGPAPEVAVTTVNGEDGDVTITAESIGAYTLPEGGIPKDDLAEDVQGALTQVAEATYSVVPRTLMQRTSTGAVSVGDPTASVHAANKKYVDDAVAAVSSAPGQQSDFIQESGDLKISDELSAGYATYDRIGNVCFIYIQALKREDRLPLTIGEFLTLAELPYEPKHFSYGSLYENIGTDAEHQFNIMCRTIDPPDLALRIPNGAEYFGLPLSGSVFYPIAD